MKLTMKKLSLALASYLILFLAAAATATTARCTFEIVVKTDGRRNAGTDARVSLQVRAARGPTLTVTNLESWGQMAAGHDYFEKGNLDRFKGAGDCMPSEPCNMVLTSDGSGNKPGWYVSYVMVTQLGQGSLPSMTHRWAVDQWLAVDEPPHMLTAERRGCGIGTAAP
uniref:PLAT domain-containing protein n=1 Tax=Oryza meridionalis TaxID=40149 RepID=A0A0E0EWY3_9ORYZ